MEPSTRRHPDHAPVGDPASSPALDEGIALFNQGRHWHAHEAWEDLWLGLEGEDKLFVQGLIMAAACLVQYGKRIERGVINHEDNARRRLQPHAPHWWGIDVAGLLADIAPFAAAAKQADWTLLPGDVQVRRA